MPASNAMVRLVRLASGLPEVTTGTSYRTPALLVRGKTFMRLWEDGETAVLLCPMEHKEFLLETAPGVYYETEHYRGWPAVLIRLGAISDDELRRRLADGWRHKAPKRLAASHDGTMRGG